ncbi:hypothetical protein F3K39_13340 [Streptomyces sp. LBUM 1479]|nr:hypothetical protein [Streptomyces sp. LBUM 1479]
MNVGPVAYGEKGVCRGVSARSGWRVNTPRLPASRFRAVPRTDTPRRAPDPPTAPRRTPHPHQATPPTPPHRWNDRGSCPPIP